MLRNFFYSKVFVFFLLDKVFREKRIICFCVFDFWKESGIIWERKGSNGLKV